MSKGGRYERKLVNGLVDDGWYAQRTAASGSATPHDLPDVVAAKNGRREVIELKYISDPPAYVAESKVKGLIWLSNHLDATPRLCLRMSGDRSFYCVTPAECPRTDSGSYRLAESIVSDAVVIAEK
jgi:Holliday junction resolvase